MDAWRRAFREALPSAAIALAVTLLRLAGERLGWSAVWFSRSTGGVVPSRLGWVVGITWLALPFGAWFAWRLARAGDRPPASGRALATAVAAVVFFYLVLRLLPLLHLGFPGFLLPVWGTAVLAAAMAWCAWPGLARVLLAYGVLSRLPVAIVMFLALQGQWGTHYDYADATAFVRTLPPATAFVWLALVPQLVFWVGYTVIVGMLGGTLLAALLRRRLPAISIASIVGLLLITGGPASPAAPAATTPADRVREREQAFARTMAERDQRSFAGFVSEEAVFVGRTVFRGRAAVVQGWKPFFEEKKAPFSWQPETVEVIASGTLALSRGPVFDADGK
ncbi:MAG TPA: nuclear transport factor 2 family protein, partial [Vicinamibacteria bacterium]|nr:nuclear transport factor 2 family protein [Vicinamibacteria bacterium]